MNQKQRLEFEPRMESLLGGGEGVASRRELLWRIVRDEEVRQLLAEMLQEQADARAAFGYDRVEGAMDGSLEKVKAALPRAYRPAAARPPGRRRTLGAQILPWLSALAAVVVMAVSLYVALTARSGKRLLEERLTRLETAMAAPALTVSEPEMARYRFLWNQVARGSNAWMLVGGAEGKFGSIASVPSSPRTRGVLLLQCQVLDEAGRRVYTANLLMPDREEMSFRLPDAGRIAGLPARLDVATTGRRTSVALSLGREKTPAAGVAGETGLGTETREIGRFRLDDRTLRVYVRTLHLREVRT